ncbi:WXG100-like domain-containing protein [Nocardia concava]|uniref:WXG100-like domain-containing protein n=1 Tax=Nocardia concava TaxID=257281 RepID=UPI0002EA79F8|nr:YwqJ-related putative deaminase [Nocardia concava]
MALELPSELEWLGWLVGMEWPEGNEDQMWDLARYWKDAAEGLRNQVSGIDAAKSATLAAYIDGDGRENMAKTFDLLAGVGGKQDGNTSILDLAGFFDQLGDSVHDTGTEIESTKLMFYSSLAILAIEIAIAWIFPPTAPAEEAAAVAGTRIAVRLIARRALTAIEEYVGKLIGSTLAKFVVRHFVLDAGLGMLQEGGIEAYQVAAGHRKSMDWGRIGVTGVSAGVGGLVGGKAGEMIGGALAKTEMNHFMSAALTGAGAGLAGAGAGFLAGTGTQFGLDLVNHGWDEAVKNAGNAFTHFDPRMLTAGVSNGGMSGLNHAGVQRFQEHVAARTAGVPTDFANIGARQDGNGVSGNPGHTGGADTGGPQTHPAGFSGDSGDHSTGARPTGDGSTARPEGGDTGGGVTTDSRGRENATPTDGQTATGGQGQTTGGDHGQTSPAGTPTTTGETHGTQPHASAGETNGSVESGVQAGKHEAPAPTSDPSNTTGSAPQAAAPVAQGSGPAQSAPAGGAPAAEAKATPSSQSNSASQPGSSTDSGRQPASAQTSGRAETSTGATDSGPAPAESGAPGASAPGDMHASASTTPAPADSAAGADTGHGASGRAGGAGAGVAHDSPAGVSTGPAARVDTAIAASSTTAAPATTGSAAPGAPQHVAGTPEPRTAAPESRTPGTDQPRTAAPEPRPAAPGPRAGEAAGARPEAPRTEDARPQADTDTRSPEATVRPGEEPPAARPESPEPVSPHEESQPRPVSDETHEPARADDPAARPDDPAARSDDPAARRDDPVEPSDAEHGAEQRDSGRDTEQPTEKPRSTEPENPPTADHEQPQSRPDRDEVPRETTDRPAEQQDSKRPGTDHGPLEEPNATTDRPDAVTDRGEPVSDRPASTTDRPESTTDRTESTTDRADSTTDRGEPTPDRGEITGERTEQPAPVADSPEAKAPSEHPGDTAVGPRSTEAHPGSEPSASGEQPRERDRDGHSERDAPADGLLVAPIPVGDHAVPRAAEHESRRGPEGEHPREPAAGDHTAGPREPAEAPAEGRAGRPERGDGTAEHPGTLDEPTDTTAAHHDSEDPAPKEEPRGNCGVMSLERLRELTGNDSIQVPEHEIGPEGITAKQLVAAAGGKLLTFEGHDAIAARLLELGSGSAALVVDHYAGPVDEHGVGAHAYLLVNEGGEIVVKDPAAGREHGYPPIVPVETKGTHAILFKADGTAHDPLDLRTRHNLDPRFAPQPKPQSAEPKPETARAAPDSAERPKAREAAAAEELARIGKEPESGESHQPAEDEHGGANHEPDHTPGDDSDHEPRKAPSAGEKLEHPITLTDEVSDPGRPQRIDDPNYLADQARGAIVEEIDPNGPRVQKDENGLIRSIDGRPVHDYVGDLSRARAEAHAAARLQGEGPCSAVAIDLRTGLITEGINGFTFDVIDDAHLHPLLGENFRALGDYEHPVMKAEGEVLTKKVKGGLQEDVKFEGRAHFDAPLRHAEVKAVNELLWARQREHEQQWRDAGHEGDPPPLGRDVLKEMRFDPRWLQNTQRQAIGEPAPACANCSSMLHDVPSYCGRNEFVPGDYRLNETGGKVDAYREPDSIPGIAGVREPEGHEPADHHASEGPPDPEHAPSADHVADQNDSWSGLSRDEVKQRLEGSGEGEFGLHTAGFDNPDLPHEYAREYGRAVEEMRRRYPDVRLGSVEIGPIDAAPEAFAATWANRDETGRMGADRIVFNERYATDPEAFTARMQEKIDAGRYAPGIGERPLYGAIVHEYGHVVEMNGQRTARHEAADVLLGHFEAVYGTRDPELFDHWLKQLPGYAFDEHGHLNPPEALAEAFRDVEMNGHNASEPAQVLHRLLTISTDDVASAAARDHGVPLPDRTPSPRADSTPDQMSPGEHSAGDPHENRSTPGTSDPNEHWLERQEAIQADWSARQEVEHAAWLREQAEHYPPGSLDRRLADLRAEHAEALARIARDRADYLWEAAGGRDENASHAWSSDLGQGSTTEPRHESAAEPGHESTVQPQASTAEVAVSETSTQAVRAADPATPVAPVDPVQAAPALRAAADHLGRSEATPGPRERGAAEQGYARRLSKALGLDEAIGPQDRQAAFRDVAENARARGRFGDPEGNVPPRPMRAEDYGRLTDDERVTPVRSEPDPGETSRRLPLEPWSDTNRGAAHDEPRAMTLDELRHELAEKLGLRPEDIRPEHLSELAGELQYRNLLRAGAIEALHDAVDRHARAATPEERVRAARVRDEWARLLGVDPDRVLPAHAERTLADLRAETLRRASDVADLVAATHATPDPADGHHLVLQAGGDRVHVKVTENPDGSHRVEVTSRPDLPVPPEVEAPAKTPGLLRRMWNRMMAGFKSHSPDYPAGSGLDDGQGKLVSIAGHALQHFGVGVGLHWDDIGDPSPLGITKQVVTILKQRERMPFKFFTNRIADISPDVVPMRTRDGREYEPWFSEADPILRAEIEESLRLAGLPTEEDYLRERAAHPPEPLPERPTLDAPPERTWGTSVPEPVVHSFDARDAALTELVHQALRHDVDVASTDPAALRGAVDDAAYRLMRRAGAIEALRDAAERFNLQSELVPPRPVAINDSDPLGRYIRDVREVKELRIQQERADARRQLAGADPDDPALEYRPREPRVTALDYVGVNNGAGDPRHFEDPDPAQPEREQGGYFNDALRRDQVAEERSNWAQLLGVGLDELTPERLAHTIADLRMQVRDEADHLAEFSGAVDHFLDADTVARDHARQLIDRTAHVWLDSEGGAMLEPGIGIRPGEHAGDPHRLVVIGADGEHVGRLARYLADHPEMGGMLNRGELRLDLRNVELNADGDVHVVAPKTVPEVRFHDLDLNGEHAPVLMVREGDAEWHVVQPEPAHAPGPESAPHESAASAPRDPDVVHAERKAMAKRLSVETADLSPDRIEATIKALRQDNALRAAQIEGMADYIRTSDAIENFHKLDRVLGNLANRLGVEPHELTPEGLARAMTDPSVKRALRKQIAGDLLDYAELVRDNVNPKGEPEGGRSKAVLEARDRLARRMGVEPEALYGSKHEVDDVKGEVVGYERDPESLKQSKLLRAVNDILTRSEQDPHLLAALAEYSRTVGEHDPHHNELSFDARNDPRVADGELPIHDRDAPALLHRLLSESIGEPPLSDNPQGAAEVWSRLLAVDISDVDRTVKLYREQWPEMHDRLSPDELSQVLRTQRDFDAQTAYTQYRDSLGPDRTPLTSEDLKKVVERVRWARSAEVYEVYRDGKIEEHERPKPDELVELVRGMREEIDSREADIDALARLAAEYNALTTPVEPAPPPRNPREVAADLAEARHQLDLARDGRDYASGRMYLEQNRPLRESDLTPERLAGTTDYLATRSSEEGGTLPNSEQRIEDLRTAAEQYHRAEARVRDLEAELHAATEAAMGPLDTPVDVWQRELASARADLEAAVAASPGRWPEDLDRVVDQVDRLSRMPLETGDIWTPELAPVRDAAQRYQSALEFLDRAEANLVDASHAEESPRERAERELRYARQDESLAEARRNIAKIGLPVSDGDLTRSWAADTRSELADTPRGELSPRQRGLLELADAVDQHHDAQDRVTRWETELDHLDTDARIAADTPAAAAARAVDNAHTALREAIADYNRQTGQRAQESDLASADYRAALVELGNTTIREYTGDPGAAFERLADAAENLHRARDLADWVDAHGPEERGPAAGETPGEEGSGETGRGGSEPDDPSGTDPAKPGGPNKPGSDPDPAAAVDPSAGVDPAAVDPAAAQPVSNHAGEWEPLGPPETHVPSDAQRAWVIESLADAGQRAHERAEVIRDRMDDLARELGVDPTGRSTEGLERAVKDALDTETARVDEVMNRENIPKHEMQAYFDERAAANARSAELSQLRKTANDGFREHHQMMDRWSKAREMVHEAAVNSVLADLTDRQVRPRIGIGGDPATVHVVSDLPDHGRILSEGVRARLEREGTPVEYRRVEVSMADGTVTVQRLRPPADPGAAQPHPAASPGPNLDVRSAAHNGSTGHNGSSGHDGSAGHDGATPDPAAAHGQGTPPSDAVPSEHPWSPAPADEWSGRSPGEIAQTLRERWRLEVTGFDRTDVEPEVLREFARAVDDMKRRFPDAPLREILIGKVPDDPEDIAYAMTRAKHENGRYRADQLILNEIFATNPEEFHRSLIEDELDGGHTPRSSTRPIYSQIVHEFGHVLDFAGQGRARREFDDVLFEHYYNTYGTNDGYLDWVHQLSKYSLHDPNDNGFLVSNPTEALPEAFTDVIMNGDRASEPARVAYKLLLEAYNDQHPGSVDPGELPPAMSRRTSDPSGEMPEPTPRDHAPVEPERDGGSKPPGDDEHGGGAGDGHGEHAGDQGEEPHKAPSAGEPVEHRLEFPEAEPYPHDAPDINDPDFVQNKRRGAVVERIDPLDESRVRLHDGLIEMVDGKPVQEYVEELARVRALEHAQTLARRGEGPVSAVAIDLRTGLITEGVNGRVTDNIDERHLHPLLRENYRALGDWQHRIMASETEARQGQSLDINGDVIKDAAGNPIIGDVVFHGRAHYDNPLRHAEVKAVNEILWERQRLNGDEPLGREVLRELRFDPRWLKDMQRGTVPTGDHSPACANCNSMLRDVPSYAGRLLFVPGDYRLEQPHGEVPRHVDPLPDSIPAPEQPLQPAQPAARSEDVAEPSASPEGAVPQQHPSAESAVPAVDAESVDRGDGAVAREVVEPSGDPVRQPENPTPPAADSDTAVPQAHPVSEPVTPVADGESSVPAQEAEPARPDQPGRTVEPPADVADVAAGSEEGGDSGDSAGHSDGGEPVPPTRSGNDGGDGAGHPAGASEDRWKWNPDWRSHVPHPPRPFNPTFPQYTPQPSQQPYPWTLPPDEQQPSNGPTEPTGPAGPGDRGPGGPAAPAQPQMPAQPQVPVHPQMSHIPPMGQQPPWRNVPPNGQVPPWGSWPQPQQPHWPDGQYPGGQPGYSNGQSEYPNGQQPGYPNGQQPGYSNGQQPGYSNGQQPGYPNGQQPGYYNGQQPGYPNGHQPGYPSGQTGYPQGQQHYPGGPGGSPRGPGMHGVALPSTPESSNRHGAPGSNGSQDNGAGNGAGGFPAGPMGSPGGQGVGGNSRSASRFPRASAPSGQSHGIVLRSHSGFGEFAQLDPASGELRSVAAGAGAPAGVYDHVDGLRVLFFRDPARGLVLQVGDQRFDVDHVGAEVYWERSQQGFHRLLVAVSGAPRCELRYSPRPADADLGLLIRDVLTDPTRRAGIFC